MLDVFALQEIVRDVTYKPGWTISVYEGRHEGPHVQIRATLPDAYDTSKVTTLDVHSSMPRFDTPDQFVSWLLWRIMRIESHEAREFFRFRGNVWDDPHADGADQDR